MTEIETLTRALGLALVARDALTAELEWLRGRSGVPAALSHRTGFDPTSQRDFTSTTRTERRGAA